MYVESGGGETRYHYDSGVVVVERHPTQPEPQSEPKKSGAEFPLEELIALPFVYLWNLLVDSETRKASVMVFVGLALFAIVPMIFVFAGILAYACYLHPHKMAVGLPLLWKYIVVHYL